MAFLHQPIDSTYEHSGSAQSMIDFMKDPNHPEYKKLFALCLQTMEDKELIKRLEIAFYNHEWMIEKQERMAQSLKDQLKEEQEWKQIFDDIEQSKTSPVKGSSEDKTFIENLFNNILDLRESEAELQSAMTERDKLNEQWKETQHTTADNIINHLSNHGITLPSGREIKLTDTKEIRRILSVTLSPYDFIKKTQFDVQTQSHMQDIKHEMESKGLAYNELEAEKMVHKNVVNKLTHAQEYNLIMAIRNAINKQLPEEHQDFTPGFVKAIASQCKTFIVDQADKLHDLFEKEIENSHLIKNIEKTCKQKYETIVSTCKDLSQNTSALITNVKSFVMESLATITTNKLINKLK